MASPVIAVIGCGWAGTRHAAAFCRAGARVAWAVDESRERAAALAGSCGAGARVATRFDEALDDPDVAAVSVCLPHDLHAPVSIAALRAGKHVLCEKPLAVSLPEADAMIAAAADAGRILMVAENQRFREAYLRVQALLEEGCIGRPVMIRMTREALWREEHLDQRPWFRHVQQSAGGMMMSGGIHDCETMRVLMGPVDSVFAQRAPQRLQGMEGDDASVAVLRFRSGAVGLLVESFSTRDSFTAGGPERRYLRVDGELGSIEIDDDEADRISVYSEAGAEGPDHRVIRVEEADTFDREVRHFLECIETGAEPITSARSQRQPLEIVLAAYESMRTGAPVIVSGAGA